MSNTDLKDPEKARLLSERATFTNMHEITESDRAIIGAYLREYGTGLADRVLGHMCRVLREIRQAAIHTLTSSLRAELEDDPIRVVNIIPGAIITNFVRTFPDELMNGFLQSVGLEPGFHKSGILSDEQLAEIHRPASAVVASADDVANAVCLRSASPSASISMRSSFGPRETSPETNSRPANRTDGGGNAE
jgi:hypothetical protein